MGTPDLSYYVKKAAVSILYYAQHCRGTIFGSKLGTDFPIEFRSGVCLGTSDAAHHSSSSGSRWRLRWMTL